MTTTLYYAPGACSFVPHMAMEAIAAATGASFEFKSIKLHKNEQNSPEYLALNPNGQVPLMVVDGQPLTQIVAICEYLDLQHPQARLLPTTPWARAQALSTIAWMNNTAHPTFTHVFMPHKFTDDADAQAKIRATAAGQFRAHLERIQGWLDCAQPWLGGAQPSFVDAYALTLLRWGGFAGIDPDSLPALKAFVDRLTQEAPVAAAMAREGIAMNTYKPPKA
ncbi:MAG: glutathione S-transferase family protein [Burkholderiaceae bacterium]